MVKTLRAYFDGQVLRPEAPLDLAPNRRYLLTVQPEDEGNGVESAYPLSQILGMATDMGVNDLSTRHSWYAHGRLEEDDEQHP